jgi:hypothetical protein
VLGAPQRFGGLLALNIPYPRNTPRTLLPHMWRLSHMPLMAAVRVGDLALDHVVHA